MLTRRSLMLYIWPGTSLLASQFCFAEASTSTFPETFFMAKNGQERTVQSYCPLFPPHIQGSRGVLRYPQEGEKDIRPWSLMIGWLGCIFQVSQKYISYTRFSPFYYLLHGDHFRVKCDAHTHLFLYQEQALIRPYWFKGDPTQKTIEDDDAISLKDHFYLMPCRPNVLVYRYGLHTIPVWCPKRPLRCPRA